MTWKGKKKKKRKENYICIFTNLLAGVKMPLIVNVGNHHGSLQSCDFVTADNRHTFILHRSGCKYPKISFSLLPVPK